MSTMVFAGASVLRAPLFTFSFPHATGAAEPAVGELVFINSAGEAAKTTSTGQRDVLGVVVSKARGIATVCMQGIVECISAAAISRGAKLISASDGRVTPIPAAGGTYSSADTENTRGIIGIALTSASGAGVKVVVALSVV